MGIQAAEMGIQTEFHQSGTVVGARVGEDPEAAGSWPEKNYLARREPSKVRPAPAGE